MKSIFTIQESGLNPHHRRQNFNSEQVALFDQFLKNPDSYTKTAIKDDVRHHADGVIQRWKVRLQDGFFVYIDCSVPAPWSTSDENGFFGLVIVIGYELNGAEQQFRMKSRAARSAAFRSMNKHFFAATLHAEGPSRLSQY